MISWRVRQILFLWMVAFVAFVEGVTNPFWIWNCVPIVVSYVLLSRARHSATNPLPEIAFFLVACGVVLFAHAAWHLDLNGTASGSLTSSLMFVVLPVYACVLGGAAYGLAVLSGSRRS
jgi:hypothetical protein